MLAGEEGILGIEFSQYALANFIGQGALACILLDGGLRTSFKSFRVGLKPALVLATWGVLASVLILGVFIAWLLGVDWRLGMLMAAIVGSTDAAAVFSLLRNGGVTLNDRVQATLELESGMNDPLAILLVTALIAVNLDPSSQTISSLLILLITQIGVGLGFGVLAGFVLVKLLPKVHLAEGMYAILIASAGLMVFGATNLLGGSGFLAIYLAGVIIGNNKVRATEHILRVMDSFAWLSQAVLFVVLGLLVTPSSLLQVWIYALLIFLFLLFVARPVAVATSLLPFSFRVREIGFISWVGLRGAVPITLAIIPVMMSVPQSHIAFNITFGLVVLSLLVQGASIPFMARVFRVWVPNSSEPKAQHEIWVGDNANITLYEFEVGAGAFAVGRNPINISNRFNAKEVKLFAVVRKEKLIAVNDETVLKQGDVVWYAMSGDNADFVARIFNNSVTKYQKESEFYGDWLLSPSLKISELPFFKANSRLAKDGILGHHYNKPKPKLGLEFFDIFTPTPQKDLESKEDSELIASLEAVKYQTIGEYLLAELTASPVIGDSVRLNERWSLVVRDMDDKGRLRGIGLKRHDKPKAKN